VSRCVAIVDRRLGLAADMADERSIAQEVVDAVKASGTVGRAFAEGRFGTPEEERAARAELVALWEDILVRVGWVWAFGKRGFVVDLWNSLELPLWPAEQEALKKLVAVGEMEAGT